MLNTQLTMEKKNALKYLEQIKMVKADVKQQVYYILFSETLFYFLFLPFFSV